LNWALCTWAWRVQNKWTRKHDGSKHGSIRAITEKWGIWRIILISVSRDPDAPKISQYAYGKDYHFVIKDKLKTLLAYIREEIGEVNGRCFVDSAPVLERDWARRSGVGWVGKHTLLLHPKVGSYFFLAELIIDLELTTDDPIRDHCGTCTRCIDACPKMEGWMFGCDICQQVCPWNRFSIQHTENEFEPHPDLLDMSKRDWEEITEEIFRKVFKKSAVKRTKFEGLKRNIEFLTNDG